MQNADEEFAYLGVHTVALTVFRDSDLNEPSFTSVTDANDTAWLPFRYSNVVNTICRVVQSTRHRHDVVVQFSGWLRKTACHRRR